MKFKEYTGIDYAQVNREVLSKWESGDVFRRSLELRRDCAAFVFYEGPPSANGMPGIHHVIARSLKDLFCRYRTMKGYYVDRKAGWDTHGLPVELGVEKALGITREDIGRKISVEDYNRACRKAVMQYTREWEDLTRRMGYWVDMEHPYITYENSYIETLWYLLKQLHEKGLLYKGYTIQPYSPAAGTGLSTHELNQPGCYRDVKDTTCTAQFRLKQAPSWASGFGDTYFLAWTTTPWTLPSNTALCVGPSIEYVAIRTYNPYTHLPMTAIVARECVFTYFSEKALELDLEDYQAGDRLIPFKIMGVVKGSELAGLEYEQLLPWVDPGAGAFRVITGDFVTTSEGTGIVHIAPTFGADDARVAREWGVPPLMLTTTEGRERPMVDFRGRYYPVEELAPDFVKGHVNTALYNPFAGRYVKNAYDPSLGEDAPTLDVDICMVLKEQNLVFRIEKHTHNYPHCWRTDKPVLYYPLDSWFIRTTACRERMRQLNDTILWKPQSTGTGRFGKWLENLQDWNLSRSRYWGTPLPVWRSEDGTEEKCIGSLQELTHEITLSIEAGVMQENPFRDFTPGDYSKENYERIDLHRPYVDRIVLVSPTGRPMYREPDLVDVWFDSGAMPYAQLHYPFENKEAFESGRVFPADFIAEGVDQTRGWFFTLHALSSMLFDSVSFRAVVSNGLVLDKNGNKMSKRLGNGVDPFDIISRYGSDPLRWYMITNASPWDNLKFDEEGVAEVTRKFFGTLYNTYSFFALYANVDGFCYSELDVPPGDRPEIDRWILSRLNSLVEEVDMHYDSYEPTRAGRAISEFVNEHLSNWYVRLNRKRFWGGQMDSDKLSAYQTLYTCLETVSRLMAPIAPFYADRLFTDLVEVSGRHAVDSVHLSDFPQSVPSLIDKALEERMQLAQDICSMVLALRRKVSIRVRQPLSRLLLPVEDRHTREAIRDVEPLILSEVNVKAIEYVENTEGVVNKSLRPDFKKLGPRYGKSMKQLSAAIGLLSQSDISRLEREGSLDVLLETGQRATIGLEDVEVISSDIPGWLVANSGKLTVALDITLSEELKQEGIARELVNRIQNLRKSMGLEITDRIRLEISPNPTTSPAVARFKQYIMNQTLSSDVIVADIGEGTDVEIDGVHLKINIQSTN